MSLALLAPLGLLALAALALPVLLHLVRRLELTTTEFAALRWISEHIRPQRRLRVERPWLLLLRLCLLALLALLLARPVWNSDAPLARSWIAVIPGASLAEARAVLGHANGEWHWLAPGFPPIDQAPLDGAIAPASLLRELDARLPSGARLSVVAPQQIRGLDGERPRLTHAVDWQIVSGTMPAQTPDAATAVTLAVRHAADVEPSLRWLRDAVAVWNRDEPGRYRLDAQPVSAPLPPPGAWLVWLAPPTPALKHWLDRGGRALTVHSADGFPGGDAGEPIWRSAEGRVLARRSTAGNGQRITLSGAFMPADLPILLDADFPRRLHDALAPPAAAPTAAMASALQPVAGDVSPSVTMTATPQSWRPLDAWLALLIAALFVLERLVATRRARGADA